MADKGSSRRISSKTSAGSINSYQKMREYPHSSRTSRFQYAMIPTASKIIPPNPQSVSESGVFVLKDDKPINSGSPSQIPKAYFLLKTHSLKFNIPELPFSIRLYGFRLLSSAANRRLAPIQSTCHESISKCCPYWNNYKIADDIKQRKIICI